jgi:hypothetical protein
MLKTQGIVAHGCSKVHMKQHKIIFNKSFYAKVGRGRIRSCLLEPNFIDESLTVDYYRLYTEDELPLNLRDESV